MPINPRTLVELPSLGMCNHVTQCVIANLMRKRLNVRIVTHVHDPRHHTLRNGHGLISCFPPDVFAGQLLERICGSKVGLASHKTLGSLTALTTPDFTRLRLTPTGKTAQSHVATASRNSNFLARYRFRLLRTVAKRSGQASGLRQEENEYKVRASITSKCYLFLHKINSIFL